MKNVNLVLIPTLVFVTGCASIITGKHQEVPVTSEPSGIKVRAGSGETITTPGEFTLIRNKNHVLVAECPDGGTQEKKLKHGLQGWFWGNILLGGIPGMVVDLITGACDELKPKQVHFTCSGQS